MEVEKIKSNDQEENRTRKCANCRREIYTGDEALTIQRVVIGLQRPIPLERAAVMRTVTPHWGRHNLTSHLLAEGQSKESIKDDLGWSSIEMVERYGHDLPGLGKARANLVQFGSDTKLTRTKKKKAEK